MNSIRLIPYVCGAGASLPGSEQGPVALERMGLCEDLRARGINVSWQESPAVFYEESPWGRKIHDALPPRGSPERREIVLWHARRIRDQVATAIKDGCLPVTLGGDHSMAAGSIAGLARATSACGRIGVLWVDAHADLNTLETTPSHAYHGMPVAALLGMGDPDFSSLGGGPVPVLSPDHVFYLGLRDIDPGEEAILRDLRIDTLDGRQIQALGAEKSFRQALSAVKKGSDYLALSIDLDAFDPAEAPATGTPVPDGLHRDEVFPVLEALTREQPFSLIEVAEFNPTRPGARQTYELLRDMLTVLLS